MTNNQLTRERIELIANFHRAMTLPPSHDEIEELARMALAAMDSEPVAYMTYKGYLLHAGDPKLAEYSEPMPLYADPRPASTPAAPVAWDYEWASCITCEGPQNFNRVIEREAPPEWAVDEGQARNIIPLYRHAQPAPERDQVRREHAEWSQVTFGNVGPIGPLKHLSKEALEAAAEPGDLSEWADMQFLLWDAQRRAGITDEQITQAMIEKLVVNKQRSWPEPKDGEPRLHIKEQPAPVVQDNRVITQHFDTIALETAREILCDVNRRHEFLGGEVQLLSRVQCRIDEACRAAMLQESQKSAGESNNCRSGENVQDLQAGNSPVIPEGYVMVPKEPTKEMIDAGWLHYMGTKNPSSKGTYKAMLAAAPQEVPDGQR
ncbi:Protein of uncharacterised function (DUF550) [Raoultella terrigena]|nr:Protein of uncharacterised function (DUF550) [Raoultella terrigena]